MQRGRQHFGDGARALLHAWVDDPTPEAAERLCLGLASWCDAAAEGACRVVGLAVDPGELVTSFWARVLLSETSDALIVDLMASFEQAAGRWMLERADELVKELAASGIERGSHAWRVLVSVEDDPGHVPSREERATVVALHRISRERRRALIAWRVYGEGIEDASVGQRLSVDEVLEAAETVNRWRDDILRRMP